MEEEEPEDEDEVVLFEEENGKDPKQAAETGEWGSKVALGTGSLLDG